MKPEIVDYICDCELKFRTQIDMLKDEAIVVAKDLKETYGELTAMNKTSYDMKIEVDSVRGNKNISRAYKFLYHIHTYKTDLNSVLINTTVKIGTKVVLKFDLKWNPKRPFSARIHTEMNNYDEITEEIARKYIEENYDYVLIFNNPKISRAATKILNAHEVSLYTGVSEEKLQNLLSKLSKNKEVG